MRAAIIGGGIGGLTAAIALERAGVEAHVYERAPELHEVGAGISLWANAIHAFDAIGLGDAIRAHGLAGREASIRTWKGKPLSATSYDTLASRYGAAIILMHRADLLAVLADKVEARRLHLGHECTGFRQDASGMEVQFSNGEKATADVLIGADGLHSVVRAQLFGRHRPRYAGYTAWRAVVRAPASQIPAGESWGRGARFGIVPLNDGRVYWFATHNEPEGGRDPEGATRQALLRLFRGWHEPIEELIGASEGSAILRNDLYDRDPLPHWSAGRVTLLGDAAHPTTPNLGQGACQAVEDAVELAASIRSCADIEEALKRYDSRRIPRTSKVVLQSRRLGQIGQWENPLLCGVRNVLTRATPRSVMERQLDWLLGYEVK